MTIMGVRSILRKIKYLNWNFYLGQLQDGEMYLQVGFITRDTSTGKSSIQHGRKWHISRHAVKSEIVNTALKAVITAVEHEARENFFYRGQDIYNTHWNVDILHNLMANAGQDIKEIRPPIKKSKVVWR